MDPQTGAFTVVSTGGLLTSADDLTIDREGRILAADRHASQVVRIDPETGSQERMGSSAPGAQWIGTAVDGRIYTQGADSVFERLELDGSRTPLAGPHDPSSVRGFAVVRPQCDDGFDNDGDGLVDWPEDPQCRSWQDDDESRRRACGTGFELAPLLAILARRRRRLASPR